MGFLLTGPVAASLIDPYESACPEAKEMNATKNTRNRDTRTF